MLATYSRALLAGLVGLAVNFLLLGLADRFGIVTARGGFQRLVKMWTGPVLQGFGVDRIWAALSLPDPNGALFTNGFKVAVGLAFAVIYVWIRPLLPGSSSRKGTDLCAAGLVDQCRHRAARPRPGFLPASTRSAPSAFSPSPSPTPPSSSCWRG
ncbi:hypothetical protein ACFSKM_00325 [Ancylobacter dichloromethanicus]